MEEVARGGRPVEEVEVWRRQWRKEAKYVKEDGFVFSEGLTMTKRREEGEGGREEKKRI